MTELPKEVRQKIREGLFNGQTSGQCPGYAQANLVVLPMHYALDFLIFCQRNPKPCPLLDVTEPETRSRNLLHREQISRAICQNTEYMRKAS